MILTKNNIELIPLCFSYSSIQILHLNENKIRFNQTTILSSSKLTYLDLSHNHLTYLPRTFLHNLRRLRTLILNGELNLFEKPNDQWIRSLTTRNQLTVRICDKNIHLPFCLFNNLLESNRLLSIELNSYIHCDCSFVYLPLEKIHFHHCQNELQQGICNNQSSIFEPGHSVIYLQTNKYRQICTKEYQQCQSIQSNKISHTTISTTNDFDLSVINESSIESSLINKSMTTIIVNTVTYFNKENITTGAIIPLVILLLLVTMVCLYVILSGHNREQITNLIMRQKNKPTGGMKRFYS